MKLKSLHFLLTYQCTFECDHCFVWGSPWQCGTFTLEKIDNALTQAKDTKSIDEIYFEGGEPFLYYSLLLYAVEQAKAMGFKVGVVTNAYWALEYPDAKICLQPLKNNLDEISVSSDLFHYDQKLSKEANIAQKVALELGIKTGVISIEQVSDFILGDNGETPVGKLPIGESDIMFRGRAVEKLSKLAKKFPYSVFDSCPYENLSEPGRVHLDPLGYVHICQGITIGNIFKISLDEICRTYNPYSHPIISCLLKGGPVEIVNAYQLEHREMYADACHMCYEARLMLREKFPEYLCPDQMYGVIGS